MKRELKFRVWTGNEMEYNITVGKFGTFYVNPENGDGLNPKDMASLTTCTTKYSDDIPVMQFTGLKDKNGKDIYEGDVLNKKTTYQNNMADRRFQIETQRLVTFEAGSFIDGNTGISLYDKLRNISYSPNGWTDYEVIGNIYESPELLK